MLEPDPARAHGKRSPASAEFSGARRPASRFSKEDWMNTPVIRIAVLLCIVGLVSLNCDQTPAANNAPTITALTLPDSVEAGTDASFSCTASDPDGEPLSYTWTSSLGTLLSTTARTVSWTAPDQSGASLITVVVRDSSGASDTTSGTVTINPIVTTIIDWSGAIEATSFQVWHQAVPAGYTLSGSFSAGTQLIRFLVLDSLDYQKWGFHLPYVGLVKVDSSMGDSFSAVVPQTGLYHFVLDNQDGGSAVTAAHLTVQSTSP
jgi:hypothetical protein